MAPNLVHLQDNVRGFYYGTKAAIEALTGVPQYSVAVGYTTTPADGEMGFYDGSAWHWGGGGTGTPAWGDITGTLSDQTDLQTALNGKLASDADYADISANDAATDVTGAELEELTDGSSTTLHTHADTTDVGAIINAAGAETALDNADKFGFWQNASGLLKSITWSNFKTVLNALYSSVTHTHSLMDDAIGTQSFSPAVDLTAFETDVHAALEKLDNSKAPNAKGVTNGDSHDHNGGDGGAIAYSSLSGALTQAAGTYAATLTNVANVDSSSIVANFAYLRLGNIVVVSGNLNVDATAAGVLTRVGISLPVASNIGSTGDLTGTGGIQGSDDVVIAQGDTTNDRAELQYTPAGTANTVIRLVFMYQII
jgi:hypothetical protein